MERKKYVDIAKTIGILWVVTGHLFMWLQVPPKYESVLKLAHMFHMPLFFLLAGLNLKLAEERPLKTAFFKRLNGIAKPYIIWCLVISGYNLVVRYELHHMIDIGIMGQTVIGPLVFAGNFVGAWFFPCLFWSQMLAVLAIMYFKPKPRTLVFFALGIIGMSLPLILPGNIFSIIHKFHRLDVVLVASLLIGIGYTIKDKNIDYGNHLYALAALVIAILSYKFNSLVNMNENQYGNMVLFLTGALSGSYLVMYAAKKIENIPYVSGVLSYVGKTTMWILFFHEAISRLLNYVLGATKADGVIAYRLVLYVIIPVALPPLAIYLYNWTKAHRPHFKAKLKAS